MDLKVSSAKATGSVALHRGPGMVAICALLIILSIWAAVYHLTAGTFKDVQEESRRQVKMATAGLGQRLTDAQGHWLAQAEYVRELTKRQSSDAWRSWEITMLLNNGSSGFNGTLYDAQGHAIAGALASATPLSAEDLAVLRRIGPNDSIFLPPERDGTPEAKLRFVSVVLDHLGTNYLVATSSKSALFGPEWVSALTGWYVVTLKPVKGLLGISYAHTIGPSALFKQSWATTWIGKLVQPVSSEIGLTPRTGFSSMQVTFYGTVAMKDATARAAVSTMGGLALSILVLASALFGIAVLSRVKRNEASLIALVTIDALTDLPNRRSLNDRLDTIFSEAAETRAEIGLLFVDLDNFKPVNDTHGHKMGDLLLRAVAHRLRGALTDTEVICRLGGDEFAIITTTKGGCSEMKRIAEAVVASFTEPFVLEGVQLCTAASVGLAYSTVCRSSSELLKNADMAMYDAKTAGKGKYREFSLEMSLKSLEKEQLGLSLKPAIGTDQFSLVYQPKVNTFTGNISGYEALLRWTHPERGPISPMVFIPLAETNGAIHELGSWVLGKAIEQIVSWHAQGNNWVTVAVNVSAVQLLDPFFVGRIKRLLDSHHVPASCLQVELTESVLVTNVAHAKKVLGQLRKLGVTIAIDDFGTGYSSLNSLQQFDIDYLKVDQSFVREMDTDAGAKICRSIVSLAHSLGMTVIAEGVETYEQFAALYEMGCDEVQGYLLAKPFPPEKVPFFRAHSLGLWAEIDLNRTAILAAGLSLDQSTATELKLLEIELEKVNTDFASIFGEPTT